MMAIDGTECVINDLSDSAATLTVRASIEGLNSKECALLLSSTGLVYRHCARWVYGDSIGVAFLRHNKVRTQGSEIGMDMLVSAEADRPA
jgi:hypothetical protein